MCAVVYLEKAVMTVGEEASTAGVLHKDKGYTILTTQPQSQTTSSKQGRRDVT